jgi:SAM-dependent methyltransferase
MKEQIQQHNKEIYLNKSSWDKKPALKKAYYELYKKIELQITDKTVGKTLEIGSGIGRIKDIIPYCTTSDIFDNPWLERNENAYQLNYPNNSLSNIVLFDVWHHLEYPMAFLSEANRVLKPGGKIILMEPDMSMIGKFVYGNLHHEPLGFNHSFDLNPAAKQNEYFAAQSTAYRFFVAKEIDLPSNQWNLNYTKRIVSFAYLASGGFSKPSLYPQFLYSFVATLDKILGAFPSLFSARLLVCLEKK